MSAQCDDCKHGPTYHPDGGVCVMSTAWFSCDCATYRPAEPTVEGRLAELEALRATVARVEALHVPVHSYCVACDEDRDVEANGNDPSCPHRTSFCRDCDYAWPCPTRRALDGDGG